MRDLAIDLVTGDLALAAGRASLTSGGGAVAQRARVRVGLWQGEYVLDQAVGVPYARLLARKDSGALCKATLRQAIATTPGLATLDTYSFALDASRHATIAFTGRTAAGEPASLGAFRAVGA